jgi:hypothetical protein
MGLRVEVRSLGKACRVVVHLDEGPSGTQGERVVARGEAIALSG